METETSLPISIRKTISRLLFYADMAKDGMKHEDILKELEFSEEDFKYMFSQAFRIANTDDFELDVVLTDKSHSCPIGGCSVRKNDKIIAWF